MIRARRSCANGWGDWSEAATSQGLRGTARDCWQPPEAGERQGADAPSRPPDHPALPTPRLRPGLQDSERVICRSPRPPPGAGASVTATTGSCRPPRPWKPALSLHAGPSIMSWVPHRAQHFQIHCGSSFTICSPHPATAKSVRTRLPAQDRRSASR